MLESPAVRMTPSEMRLEYRRLLKGTHSEERSENVLFNVFSVSLDEGRGDLFVALGLARALERRGWGVAFRGISDWGQEVPEYTTVTVAMLQDALPVHGSEDLVRIAWARNWIDDWAGRTPLWAFDGVLGSSQAAVDFLREKYSGPMAVLPIAVDAELFQDHGASRDLQVCTTVNLWGEDRALTRDLESFGLDIPVHWYGNGTGEMLALGEKVLLEGAVDYVDVSAVYARSVLVLDDLTPSTRKFGCQNSRLYEALASGSLVITNCELGLEELGLEDVPVVGRDGSLEEIVSRLLGDEEGRNQLAKKLRTKVLRDHTFEQRADEFVEFLEHARCYIPSRKLIAEMFTENHELRAERDILELSVSAAQEEVQRFRKRLEIRVGDRLRRLFSRRT